jgi:DNA mismatch repair ATPase MutS
VVVTGANRGGKTTFLKAVGQSLVLARAGLFVPADEFAMPSTGAVYTHFPRQEDRTLSYGKFEEEVKRLSDIIKSLRRGDYVLMDESLSYTNQVEASVVAEEVVAALVDSGVYVFYVTFLQDFLNRFLDRYR